MTVFYYISFFISVFLLINYVGYEEKNSNNLMVALLCGVIANGGYLALVLSKNLPEALLANKLTYVGGCFLPVAAFLISCELCNIKIHRVLKTVMYSMQMLIYACVCTTGYMDLYYKTVEYHRSGEVAYLTKTYGVLHVLYPISLYLYVLLTVLVLALSLRRKNVVSTKTVGLTFLNYIIIALTYTLERVFKCKVELVPFVYALNFSYICYIVRKSPTFSISNNAQKRFDKNNIYGYIEFDRNLHYMGCNGSAIHVIPELKQIPLDKLIPEGDNFLYNEVYQMLKDYKETNEQTHIILKAENKAYELQASTIKNKKGNVSGYVVELTDATEHQKYLEIVERYNQNLKSEVDEKTHKIRAIQDRIIMGMAQMVESRDLSTGGHIKRTSEIVKVFSKQLLKENLGFSREFLYYVQKSAPMHDLGKIAVDDAILRKQGKFTPEEYAIMKKHSEAGAVIVNSILTGVEEEEFVTISTNIAHYHHEKVDGSGYPQGLKGDDIPVEARIMALADVFDALVSKRCYKEAFSYDEAFHIIEDSIGTHFDERLGKAFLKCRKELEALYNKYAKEEHC